MYSSLKNKAVLYVEDELDVLKNIATLLNNFFQKVYLGPDGETGYQIFLNEHIDVLLIDIELPGINGIELIKKIRALNKDIPIVIITAYTDKNYLLDAVELNLSKYIVKPLTSSKINTLLDSLNEHFIYNDRVVLTPDISLLKNESCVSYDNKKLKLTKKELSFLIILAKKKAVSYDEIHILWNGDTPTQNAIRVFIKQLRKKLPDNTIKTANDMGYFIERH